MRRALKYPPSDAGEYRYSRTSRPGLTICSYAAVHQGGVVALSRLAKSHRGVAQYLGPMSLAGRDSASLLKQPSRMVSPFVYCGCLHTERRLFSFIPVIIDLHDHRKAKTPGDGSEPRTPSAASCRSHSTTQSPQHYIHSYSGRSSSPCDNLPPPALISAKHPT